MNWIESMNRCTGPAPCTCSIAAPHDPANALCTRNRLAAPLVGDGELPVQPMQGLADWLLMLAAHPDDGRDCDTLRRWAREVQAARAAPVGQPAPDLAGVLEALEKMLDAMEMQEKREAGYFHINGAVALGIWRDAQELGRAAITTIKRGNHA